jgi:hypothetical protein
MDVAWAETEFEGIDLGDARRSPRAIRLVDRLSAKPSANLPQACADWVDTIAVYRLFGHDEVQ